MDIQQTIQGFLRRVKMPARYIGAELNAVQKDLRDVDFRMALCYPDAYEIGMSHLGLLVLYHLANRMEGVFAERCFAPWPDMAEMMGERKIPLFSLETKTPLKELDLIGMSLQHELLYTNVLYMLDLAGLPFESKNRDDSHPILAAGGSGALSPEPLARVFDLFLPGDGEVSLPELITLLRECKKRGASKEETLKEAASALPFVYVPCLYEPRTFKKLYSKAPDRVRVSLAKDLDHTPMPEAPVQPAVRCVHERITLEIMRGCTRGCRFCQAGMTRRPLRTRSAQRLFDAAKTIYANTGYDEISLCSLSTSDYPQLASLMELFNTHFKDLKVGLSIPSLRVGQKMQKIPGLAGAVRKAGLTLAPEAATEHLRRRINKAITDQDLEEGVLQAFHQGWRRVKLYFMIGLPGETNADVLAIADLARRISDLRKKIGKGPATVTVSVSTFVPKAHTPFQWAPMARPAEIKEKHQLLLKAKLPPRIRLNFHSPSMSLVEGILARGDQQTFKLIKKAYEAGACFDAWKDRFQLSNWEKAFENKDLEQLLHTPRGFQETLPWDIIDTGVSREFLLEEYHKSLEGEVTPYCEIDACNSCGLSQKFCAQLKKSRMNQK